MAQPINIDVILSGARSAQSKDLRFANRGRSVGFVAITFGIRTTHPPNSNLYTMHDRCYYTYIVASRTHVLYIGVTGNIERRIAEHKEVSVT